MCVRIFHEDRGTDFCFGWGRLSIIRVLNGVSCLINREVEGDTHLAVKTSPVRATLELRYI